MGPGNRPLDMEWLEDFMALAKSGNFSRAAEARAIAQPAFSRHIRALEEWVGVDLVDRSAHSAGMTAAGQRFLPLLQEVLADLEAARIKARAAHDEETASLRFAVTHVLSLYFFPLWLIGLEDQLRLGPVQTMSDNSQACEDMMLQRRVQFVMCYGHPQVPGRLDDGQYPVLQLEQERLVPVCVPDPQGQPLFAMTTTDRLPVLTYTEASGLGRIMKHQLKGVYGAASGKSEMPGASVVFSAHNALLLKTMVLKGKGIAWLPARLVADELSSGHLVDAGAGRWQVPIDIRLYRQRAEMAEAAEALWQVVSVASAQRPPPGAPHRPGKAVKA